MAKDYDYLFKLLLIGDSGVGKTSLLVRFADETFSTSFITTIGIDFKIKTMELEGKKVKLQVWDTAGQERFRTITTSYYRGATGIMLVYDVTSSSSFNNINQWMQNIAEHANSDVEKMLIGNKNDLNDRREISCESGTKVANEHGILFAETSAKSSENVDHAFRLLTLEIKKKYDSRGQNSKVPENGHKLTKDVNKRKKKRLGCSLL